MVRSGLAVSLLMIQIFACGCARSLTTLDDARNAFVSGDLAAAQASFAELSDSNGRLAEVASLDLAIVDLAAGNSAAAERRLRELRDQFDQQPTVAPVHEAAAIITDDNARVFQPAGYEQVMIRTMLAVCSLADDGVDAESYALQANRKQAELAKAAEQKGILNVADVYQPIAFAPYLRGMLREATHRDYDDATKAYQLVSSVQPQFAPAVDDIARASGGTHSAPGHGVLYVIACVGRGPVLQQTTAETTSAALAIASTVWNAETNRGERGKADVVLPNIASVKVPGVVVPPAEVAAIGVRIDGALYGATQTLTDVGQLAVQQVESEMPWTIARAVLRRAAKEYAVAKATSAMGLRGNAGSLFHFAAASSWSGIEKADIRCWGLLPREIQVFRGELPVGQHQIQLQAMGPSGMVLDDGQTESVSIVDGQNRYLFVICPDRGMYLLPPSQR